MRSGLPLGGTKAGFDRVAHVLDVFEIHVKERLNSEIIDIAKAFYFRDRCGNFVIAFLLLVCGAFLGQETSKRQ